MGSDSITGINARTFMVAAINPSHEAETVSTLKYAQQYSSLKSNQEEINKAGAIVRKSLAHLQQLRKMLQLSLKDTDWTRRTLKAQMDLSQAESAQTRHLFTLLRDVEHAEARHAEREEALKATRSRTRRKEAAL